MTQATYLWSDGDYVDRLDIETYRKRLEAALELASKLKAGVHVRAELYGRNDPEPPANVIRHTSYYNLASGPEAEDENCRLIVVIEHDDNAGKDFVELAFQATDGLLGFHIREPLAADLFNYLEPSAPIEKIVAIVARWSDWLERVALPAGPIAHEMNLTMDRATEALVELLRVNGHEDLPAANTLYSIRYPNPFREPQIYVHLRPQGQAPGPHPCFTPAGQAMLAKALPTILKLKHYRQDGSLVLTLDKLFVEEIYVETSMHIMDRLKAFASLPDTGSENLFEPLPELLPA